MAFEKSGVQFEAKGVGSYISDLGKANKAQQDLGKSAGNFVSSFGGASSAISNTGGVIGGFGSKLTSVIPSVGGLVSALGNMATVAGGIIAANLITKLTEGLIGFGAQGVIAATNVDHQMAQVAATLGITKDAATPLKDLLLELSLDPGLTVNATQAGEAIEMLARNGLEVEEIMNGAAKGTVALANATGSDFATAADVATDAMAQFGFKAEELSGVADSITGVITNSKFTINDYALALASAGGIAGNLGVDFTDLNTVLAATASNFSSGSDAGTSFKTLLTRLSDPTAEVKAAMQEYGISIFDADGKMRNFADIAGQLNQVFNGTVTLTSQVGGATKEQAKAAEKASAAIGDLTRDIARQEQEYQLALDVYNEHLKYYDASEPKMRAEALALQKKADALTDQREKLIGYQQAIAKVDGAQAKTITTTKELTEAEKARLATIIGGTDGMRTVLGLAQLTEEEFAALSKEVNANGLAYESAATRVDSLKGAWEIFKGIIEAVQIQIGDKFLPIIRKLTEGFSSFVSSNSGKVVDFFGGVATGIEKVTGAFSRFGVRGATVSILGMLGLEQSQISIAMTAFDTITTAIDKVSRAFQNFGIRGATVSILGQLGMDPETIGMVKTTIDETITFITESFATISTIYQQFGAQGAAVSLLSILGFSSDTIGTITTVVQAIIDTVNSLVDWWVTSWPLMQAAALTGWEIIKGIFAGFENVATVVGAQLSLALNNITMALNKMGLDWGQVWDAVVKATGIVVAAIGVALLGIVAAIAGVVTGVTGAVLAITETWAGLIDSAVQIVTGLATTWAGFVNLFNALVAGEWTAAWEAFKLVIQGGVTTISGLLQGMLTLFTGAFNTVVGLVGGFATGVIAVFTGLYDTLIGHSIIPDLINGITKWFRDLPQKIVNALTGMASKVLKPIQETAKGMVDAWKETDWVELGVSTVDGVLEGLKENAHLVWEFFKEMAQKAWSEMASSIGFGSPAREFMPLGQSMVQGLISGAQDQDFAAGFIDSLNMGTIARELGGGGSGWKEMRRIISQAIENNMGLLASGNTQAMMAVIGDTAAQFGFPPSVAQEFAQANGLLDGLSERYQEMMRVIRVEGLATAIGVTGQFSGIAGSLAGMLESQMGNFEEARRVYADFTKENEKLIQEFAKLTAESDKLNESMAKESERLEKLQIDLGQAEEKHRILGFEMALNRQKLEELNDELLAVTNEYGANSAEAEKVRDKIIATQIALDKQTVAYSEGEQKINEINAAIQEQSAALEELNQKLIDNKKAQEEATAAQAALKAQNLAKMFKTLTMGHGGLGPLAPLADQIAALQAFLDSGEATLSGQVWDDAMGEMANWSLDQVTAQAKLNELLAEQARKEEQILKAKEAQQKIDFLSQQVNLLKLIQDQGLNPADILGGITLGLNASIDDLLAATNSVVEAMIEQINQDLQISSPSKVMARIGKRITQGLGKGIEMGGGFVSKAMQRVPLMNLGGMMQPLTLNDRSAGAAAAGPVNTSNYNFYQTVNSGASASAVTQQFEVARALLGT